ncbi:MAG TPA: CAP domain-containing protein, partial [Chloroflexia bacterium]|nr:CAP domain-containing protein [Chloroflexia bacterium]
MKNGSGIVYSLCIVLLFALLPVSTLGITTTGAAQSDRRCFPQTGECIEGEFRLYWEQNGGLPVFGYPIAPARPEIDAASSSIFLVQWFERNRFELHPENKPPYRVLLGRLGDQLLRQNGRDPLTLPRANPSAQHYFSETGHAIAVQFWDYWRTHGLELGDAATSLRESLALFGYPITEAQMEPAVNGQSLLTQWFERARFEYHPNNPEQSRVLLGLLGNEMNVTSPGKALDRLNYYRQQVGAPPVEQHPSLVVSAQGHANYLVLNGESSNPHIQAAGRPGYTGAQIVERVQAAGYGYTSGYRVSNVLVPIEDPAASIDALIDMPLHRVVVLNTDYRQAGYGRAALAPGPASGRKSRVAYSVVDVGTGPLDTMPTRDP